MSKASEAKTAWAMKALAPHMKNGISPVIVLPEFYEDNGQWVPTEECVVANANSTKGFGYVQLFQARIVKAKGVEFENNLWAIQRGKVLSMETRYKAGMLLAGNIVVEDTFAQPNPNNEEQDLKMTRVSAGNTVPCLVDDQPIYSIKYWDETGLIADTTITHNNQADIEESIKQATVAAALATGKLKGGAAPGTPAPKPNALNSRKAAGAKI